MANVWWVNQRAAEKLEDFEIVWAPLFDKQGHRHSHWELMDEVATSDVILHYSKQQVVAISTADGPAYKAPRPWDDTNIADKWIQDGRRISVDVAPLDAPLPIKSLDLEKLAPYTGPGSPFQTGTFHGQQGYFFRVPAPIADAIFEALSLDVDLNPSDPGTDIVINGATDHEAIAKIRAEQPELRRRLLGGQQTGTCALCGRRFPANYLMAAHIKQRRDCTEQERLDSHVAMLACAFGCDAAFERGDVYVDPDGYLRVREDAHDAVAQIFAEFRDRPVEKFGPATEKYFEARRLQHHHM